MVHGWGALSQLETKPLHSPTVQMRKLRCAVRCPRLVLASASTGPLKLGSHPASQTVHVGDWVALLPEPVRVLSLQGVQQHGFLALLTGRGGPGAWKPDHCLGSLSRCATLPPITPTWPSALGQPDPGLRKLGAWQGEP